MSAHQAPFGRTGTLPFLLGSALLGSIGIFVHAAGADPLTTTWFRCAFGLLGLTLWVLLRGQAGALRLTPVSAPGVLGAGVLLVSGWALFFAAIERTGTGVAVVLFQVQPLWVLALGAWWLKEPVSRQHCVSVGVALLGLVLATGAPDSTAGSDAAASVPGYWVGVGCCLVGALCTACVTVLARRLRDIPAGVLAWWQCAIGTATLWLWPLEQGWPAWGTAWLWLAGLGWLHTGLAYSLMYAGMARLSTERIAVLQYAYPLVAVVIDACYFGQRLGRLQWCGIGLIALAVGWAQRVPAQRRA